MKVRFRMAPRRFVSVDVSDADCPRRECFWINQHTIRSAVGASGCGSQTTDWWECGRRDQTGCPKDRPIAKSPYYRKRRGAWEAVKW